MLWKIKIKKKFSIKALQSKLIKNLKKIIEQINEIIEELKFLQNEKEAIEIFCDRNSTEYDFQKARISNEIEKYMKLYSSTEFQYVLALEKEKNKIVESSASQKQ